MSLFSSKSKSTTQNTTNYHQTSATNGDFSSGNVTVTGDYFLGDGISEASLQMTLENNKAITELAFGNLQNTSKNAIDTVSKAYGEAYNETRSVLTEIKPLFMWGVIGLVGYKLLGGKL